MRDIVRHLSDRREYPPSLLCRVVHSPRRLDFHFQECVVEPLPKLSRAFLFVYQVLESWRLVLGNGGYDSIILEDERIHVGGQMVRPVEGGGCPRFAFSFIERSSWDP